MEYLIYCLFACVGGLTFKVISLSWDLETETNTRRELQKQVLELATTLADSLSTIRQALR